MIKNTRQLYVSKKRIEELSGVLDSLPDVDPKDNAAARRTDSAKRSLESLLKTLQRQVAEFEALAGGNTSGVRVQSLADLPKALIQMRIASGMSQRDLAAKLDVKTQQVQRWEHEDYENIGFERLLEVADALGLAARITLKRAAPVLIPNLSTLIFGGPCKPSFGTMWTYHSQRGDSAPVRSTTPAIIHAVGEVRTGANDGASVGRVSVVETSHGMTVRLAGMNNLMDGFYSKNSGSTKNADQAHWTQTDMMDKAHA